MLKRLWIILLLPFFLIGCSIRPTSVSFTQAIDGISNDFARRTSVSLTHTTTWQQGDKWLVTQYLRHLQCKQQTADPIVAVIDDELSIELDGSYTQTGAFTISASSGIPGVSASGTSQRSSTQKLTLPVTFYPFSQLPVKLLQKQLHDAKIISDSFVVNDPIRLSIIADIRDNYTNLTNLVTSIVPEYKKDFCNDPLPKAPDYVFFGTKK